MSRKKTKSEIVANLETAAPAADEAVIEQALAQIEADELAAFEAEFDDAIETNATPETADFATLMAQIGQQEAIDMAKAMTAALDERMAFESVHGNPNIQRTLKGARDRFSMPSTAAVLIACAVNPAFVNRSVAGEKRYNVYAMGKLADLANGLAHGRMSNAINLAIVRSMIALQKAGEAFTMETAKAAASDKIRIDPKIARLMSRHTVSASTAPTQASSTMQALETLGLVSRAGSSKNPTYSFTNHPGVAKLEAALAA